MKIKTLFVTTLVAAGATLMGCGGGGGGSDSAAPASGTSGTGSGSGTGNSSSVTTLATGLKSPVGVAVDANYVYWTESENSTGPATGTTRVRKVGLNGGTVTTLYEEAGQPNYVNTWSLAIDSHFAYWTQNNAASKTMKRVALAGGTLTTLAVTGTPSGDEGPNCLAIGGNTVYFTDGESIGFGLVKSIPKSGGPVASTLASVLNAPWPIVVDSSSAYYVNTWDGSLQKVPLTGLGVTTLATGASTAYGSQTIAIDSTNVYFLGHDGLNNQTINSVPLGGGATTVLVQTADANGANSLVLDDTSIFWTVGDSIKKAGKSGGAVTTINTSHTGGSTPTNLALDAAYIYWVDSATVNKIAKP